MAKSQAKMYPNAPCREYLPTFPLECSHFSPNVGKYSHPMEHHGAWSIVPIIKRAHCHCPIAAPCIPSQLPLSHRSSLYPIAAHVSMSHS